MLCWHTSLLSVGARTMRAWSLHTSCTGRSGGLFSDHSAPHTTCKLSANPDLYWQSLASSRKPFLHSPPSQMTIDRNSTRVRGRWSWSKPFLTQCTEPSAFIQDTGATMSYSVTQPHRDRLLCCKIRLTSKSVRFDSAASGTFPRPLAHIECLTLQVRS